MLTLQEFREYITTIFISLDEEFGEENIFITAHRELKHPELFIRELNALFSLRGKIRYDRTISSNWTLGHWPRIITGVRNSWFYN